MVTGHPYKLLSMAPLQVPMELEVLAVDGTVGEVKTTTDKKGNVTCNFSVTGVGISAQVSIRLTHGRNNVSATVNPNFNSNRLTLDGKLVPLSESNIFKGRSF